MSRQISIQTSDREAVKQVLGQLYVPPKNSHKGQNGKILIIGGSSLFHSPPQWAAEIASHIVDMVHLSSTYENNRIYTELKKNFRNGIIVSQKDIDAYAKEDDVVMIGSGMVRGESDEAHYTARITQHLLTHFPDKKFILDAGALQMMKTEWVKSRSPQPILTPHQLEFEHLFGVKILKLSKEDKIKLVEETAHKYGVILLLKAVYDIVTDGETTYVIEGGNAGLTKGGTGDLLAGLTGALYTRNEGLVAAAAASCLLKAAADNLYKSKGYWYNMNDILGELPQTAKSFT